MCQCRKKAVIMRPSISLNGLLLTCTSLIVFQICVLIYEITCSVKSVKIFFCPFEMAVKLPKFIWKLCQLSFLPLKNKSGSFSGSFLPRPIFLHRLPLLPLPTLMTEASHSHHYPLQIQKYHQLSSPQKNSSKPFSSSTPLNLKAQMIFQL